MLLDGEIHAHEDQLLEEVSNIISGYLHEELYCTHDITLSILDSLLLLVYMCEELLGWVEIMLLVM